MPEMGEAPEGASERRGYACSANQVKPARPEPAKQAVGRRPLRNPGKSTCCESNRFINRAHISIVLGERRLSHRAATRSERFTIGRGSIAVEATEKHG